MCMIYGAQVWYGCTGGTGANRM